MRVLAAFAAGACLMAGVSSPAWADAPNSAPNPAEMRQNWARHREQWIKSRLAKMADRLEIKSSQQGAWENFVNVVQEQQGVPANWPGHDADAATIARFRADLATAHAKKLTQIADATATLQAALTPEQRKTLDQIVRHAGRHGRMNGAMQHQQHRQPAGRQ